MKVSLINVNLTAQDAIGASIVNQVRFFRSRGDDVQVYVLHPPQDVPADVQAVTHVVTLRDLIGETSEHFRLSDLFVYHYPGHYDLMESIRGIERGTVIFYYHNVTPPDLWGSDQDRALLMRSIESTALAHYADLCIADSPFNQQDLVERVGIDADRVLVLPLGVPLERFTPGGRDPELVQRYGLEGKPTLLYVGRMAGNKRIDLLVEALAQVQQQAPGARLLLVGDDRGAPAFREIVAATRARAEELGIADDVVWAGRVDDLPAHYRLADVYVTASLHEGFGVPLLEAMASGVPVVASRVGAMPWVLSDAGLLCEPGSASDLAEKVLSVLQNDTLRQSLVARGLERVQAFSLEQYAAGLAEIVASALTYTLPEIPMATEPDEAEGRAALPTARSRDNLLQNLLADEIEAKSDIMLRGYSVHSRLPLIGPLVAWVRRNLTSHLREPYLDPTLERQVDLNRRIAEWLKRAARAGNATAERQAALEARVQALEAQVEALTRHLDNIPPEEPEP
jgi:glycosyltransferase involved in cell wall biosynthesis